MCIFFQQKCINLVKKHFSHLQKYSTPFKNLYLCGPGTHPGGGLHGMNGYNAAKKVLKD